MARRRWQLYPERKDDSGRACEPTELELDSLMLDPDKLAEWRAQLSDISEFMKAMNERIARLANSEDGKSGQFWQERFRARRLLDEMAVVACSLYIDLNGIRARMAKTVESSEHTSAYARVLAQIKRRERAEALGASDGWSDYLPDDPDFFLCPAFEQDCAPLLGPAGAEFVAASQATDPWPLMGSLAEVLRLGGGDSPAPNLPWRLVNPTTPCQFQHSPSPAFPNCLFLVFSPARSKFSLA